MIHTVCMYVDDLASMSSTPESEYEDIEWDLRQYVFGDIPVTFKVGVTPKDISPNTSIYVIDFGALSCYGSGYEYKADYLSRELLRAIEDNPDTFFCLWSSFTVRHYQYIACEDKGLDCLSGLQKPANVFLWDSYSTEDNNRQLDKIRQLLGLPVVTEEFKESQREERYNRDIFSADDEMD